MSPSAPPGRPRDYLRHFVTVLLVLGSFVLDSDASQCSRKCSGEHNVVNFMLDKEYAYKFSIKHSSAIDQKPEHQQHLIEGVAVVYGHGSCEFAMRLFEVTIKDEQNAEVDVSELKKQLQEYSTPFAYDNGRVERVCPSFREDQLARNVKAALISQLQVATDILDDASYVSEDDVLGNCFVEYKPTYRAPKFYDIEKRKASGSCSNRFKTYAEQTNSDLDFSDGKQKHPLIDTDVQCKLLLEKESVPVETSCTETLQTKTQKVITVVTMKKDDSQPAHDSLWTIPHSMMRKEEPHFRHPNFYKHPKGSEEEAIKIVKQLGKTDTAEQGRLFASLIEHLSALDKFDKIKEAATEMNNEIYFIAALGATKTEAAMIALLQHSDYHLKSNPLFSLQFMDVYEVTSNMIQTMESLYSPKMSDYSRLLFASPVRRYCLIQPDCMSEDKTSDLVKKIVAELPADCNSKPSEAIATLKAIGNMGLSASPKQTASEIFNCLRTSTKAEVAITALEAFRHFDCKNKQDEIYNNMWSVLKEESASATVRISAYLALTECWTTKLFEDVVEFARSDLSPQVASFIASHLNNIFSSNEAKDAKVRGWLLDNYNVLHKIFGNPNAKSGWASSRVMSTSHSLPNLLSSAPLVVKGDAVVMFDKMSPIPTRLKMQVNLGTENYRIGDLELTVGARNLVELDSLMGINRPMKNPKPLDEIFRISSKQSSPSDKPSSPELSLNIRRNGIDSSYILADSPAALHAKLWKYVAELSAFPILSRRKQTFVASIGGLPVEQRNRLVAVLDSTDEHFRPLVFYENEMIIRAQSSSFGSGAVMAGHLNIPLPEKCGDFCLKLREVAGPRTVFGISLRNVQINNMEHKLVDLDEKATTKPLELSSGSFTLSKIGRRELTITANRFDGFELKYEQKCKAGMLPSLRKLLLSARLLKPPADASDIVYMALYEMHDDEGAKKKFIEARIHLPNGQAIGGRLNYDTTSEAIDGDMTLGKWQATAKGSMTYDSASQKRSFDLLFESNSDKKIQLKASTDYKSELLAEMSRMDGEFNRKLKVHLLKHEGVKSPGYQTGMKKYALVEFNWDDFSTKNQLNLQQYSNPGSRKEGSILLSYKRGDESSSYKYNFQIDSGSMFNNDQDKVEGRGYKIAAEAEYTSKEGKVVKIDHGITFFKSDEFRNAKKPAGAELAIYFRYPEAIKRGFDIGLKYQKLIKSKTVDAYTTSIVVKVPAYSIDAYQKCEGDATYRALLRFLTKFSGKCTHVLQPDRLFADSKVDFQLVRGTWDLLIDTDLPKNKKFVVKLGGVENYKILTAEVEGVRVGKIKAVMENEIDTKGISHKHEGQFFQNDKKTHTFRVIGNIKPWSVFDYEIVADDVRTGEEKRVLDLKLTEEQESNYDAQLKKLTLVRKFKLKEKVHQVERAEELQIKYDGQMSIPLQKFKFKTEGKQDGITLYAAGVKFVPFKAMKFGLKFVHPDPVEYMIGYRLDLEDREFKAGISLGRLAHLKVKGRVRDDTPAESFVSMSLQYKIVHELDVKGHMRVFKDCSAKCGFELDTESKTPGATGKLMAILESKDPQFKIGVVSLSHEFLLTEITPIPWSSVNVLFDYDVSNHMKPTSDLSVTVKRRADRGVNTFSAHYEALPTPNCLCGHKLNGGLTGFDMQDYEFEWFQRQSHMDNQVKYESALTAGFVGKTVKYYTFAVTTEKDMGRLDGTLSLTVDARGTKVTIDGSNLLDRGLTDWDFKTTVAVDRSGKVVKTKLNIKGDRKPGQEVTVNAELNSEYAPLGKTTLEVKGERGEKFALNIMCKHKEKVAFALDSSANLKQGENILDASINVSSELTRHIRMAEAKALIKKDSFKIDTMLDGPTTSKHMVNLKGDWNARMDQLELLLNFDAKHNEKEVGVCEVVLSTKKPLKIRIEFAPVAQISFKTKIALLESFEAWSSRNLGADLAFEMRPFIKPVALLLKVNEAEDESLVGAAKLSSGYDNFKMLNFDLKYNAKGKTAEIQMQVDALGVKENDIKATTALNGKKASGKLEIPSLGQYEYEAERTDAGFTFKATSGDAKFKAIDAELAFQTHQSKLLLSLDTTHKLEAKYLVDKADGDATVLDSSVLFVYSGEEYINLISALNYTPKKAMKLDAKLKLKQQKIETLIDLGLMLDDLKMDAKVDLSPAQQSLANLRITGALKSLSEATLKVNMNDVEMLDAEGRYTIKHPMDFKYFLKLNFRMSPDSEQIYENSFDLKGLEAQEAYVMLKAYKLDTGVHFNLQPNTEETGMLKAHVNWDQMKRKIKTNLMKFFVPLQKAQFPMNPAKLIFEYNDEIIITVNYQNTNGKHMVTFNVDPYDIIGLLHVSTANALSTMEAKFILESTKLEPKLNLMAELSYAVQSMRDWSTKASFGFTLGEIIDLPHRSLSLSLTNGASEFKGHFTGQKYVVTEALTIKDMVKSVLTVGDATENGKTLFTDVAELKPGVSFTNLYTSDYRISELIYKRFERYAFYWDKRSDQGLDLTINPGSIVFKRARRVTSFDYMALRDKAQFTLKSGKSVDDNDLEVQLSYHEGNRIEVTSNLFKDKFCGRFDYKKFDIRLALLNGKCTPESQKIATFRASIFQNNENVLLLNLADHNFGFKWLSTVESDSSQLHKISSFWGKTKTDWLLIAKRGHLELSNTDLSTVMFYKRETRGSRTEIDVLINVNNKRDAYWELRTELESRPVLVKVKAKSWNGVTNAYFGSRSSSSLAGRIQRIDKVKQVENIASLLVDLAPKDDDGKMLTVDISFDITKATAQLLDSTRLLDGDHVAAVMERVRSSIQFTAQAAGGALAEKVTPPMNILLARQYLVNVQDDLAKTRTTMQEAFEQDAFYQKSLSERLGVNVGGIKMPEIKDLIANLKNSMSQSSPVLFDKTWLAKLKQKLSSRIHSILKNQLLNGELAARIVQDLHNYKLIAIRKLSDAMKSSGKKTDFKTNFAAFRKWLTQKSYFFRYLDDALTAFCDTMSKVPFIVDLMEYLELVWTKLQNLCNTVVGIFAEGKGSIAYDLLVANDLYMTYEHIFKPDLFKVSGAKDAVARFHMEKFIPKQMVPFTERTIGQVSKILVQPLLSAETMFYRTLIFFNQLRGSVREDHCSIYCKPTVSKLATDVQNGYFGFAKEMTNGVSLYRVQFGDIRLQWDTDGKVLLDGKEMTATHHQIDQSGSQISISKSKNQMFLKLTTRNTQNKGPATITLRGLRLPFGYYRTLVMPDRSWHGMLEGALMKGKKCTCSS